MRKVVTLALVLLCVQISKAQVVPGYQGKRTYLEYNFFAAPTILGITEQGTKFGFGAERSLSAWSMRHKFNMNYVTKRNSEVGGSISTVTTGILDSASRLGGLRFTSIGFNLNRYMVKSTGALAPLGRYFRFETQYVQAASYMVNQSRSDFHFGYIGAGIGTRTVLRDFLTVNFSFQTGFILPIGASTNSADENFRMNEVRARMQSYYLYEANVGLGILLF